MYSKQFYLNPTHHLRTPLISISRILITVIINSIKVPKPIRACLSGHLKGSLEESNDLIK